MKFNYYQIERIISLIEQNPNAARILFYLIDQSDDNNFSELSYLKLDDALNISVPKVVKAVKLLEELKFIKVVKLETHHECQIEECICNFFK